MTKFRILTGLLLLLGGGSAASAADLGIAPAPVAPDSFWDGFYAGIHAGAGGGTTDKYFTSTGDFRNAWDLSGGLLGVHAGAATSIDQLVLGVEADLDFANITGDDAGNGDATETITIGTQASLRGRLGYDAGGLLLYATAGLAVADVTATSVLDFAPFTSNEESQLYVGWTAGLGLEARVSDAWSIGAEYRYTDLGDRDFAWPDFTDATYDLTSHAVRARASYHF